MSVDNDPRPGRPRTSTDEISVKLVAEDFEDLQATCEELSRAKGAKILQENAQEPISVACGGPLILHDNTHPYITDIVTKKILQLWVGSVTSCARRVGSDGSMSASGPTGPGFNLGGVVNFNLKIFNLGARRGGDVHFLIARLYITVLD